MIDGLPEKVFTRTSDVMLYMMLITCPTERKTLALLVP